MFISVVASYIFYLFVIDIGNGLIPANSNLTFDITLVDVRKDIQIDVTDPVSCSKDAKTRKKDVVTFNYIGRLGDGKSIY